MMMILAATTMRLFHRVFRPLLLAWVLNPANCFGPRVLAHSVTHIRSEIHLFSSSSTRAKPRSGFLQSLLDFALESPLWKLVLVPQARKKMVDTAASNGIPWIQCREWLENQSEWILTDDEYAEPPAYYLQPFHAYDKGNLCWEAAWEAEIASAAVGARNFPLYGSKGETAFRTCFQESLQEIGATVPDNAVIVDLGCGTGMSTRWIAQHYPQASRILGIDLSPFMIAVGRKLLEAAPKSVDEGGTWINAIQQDKRIEYRIGAAENTGLPDNSVDIVNLQFVAHEMPANVTLQVLTEAHRILKTGGQVWFCEMDFEAPAYAAQRANPLLFSLIRSTEPYLDDYADGAQEFRHQIKRLFDYTKLSAATGRHFAVVAIKGSSSQEHVLEDLRFDQHGNYAVEDTHLQVWENKL